MDVWREGRGRWDDSALALSTWRLMVPVSETGESWGNRENEIVWQARHATTVVSLTQLLGFQQELMSSPCPVPKAPAGSVTLIFCLLPFPQL